MNLTLSFCKSFKVGVRLLVLMLVLSSTLGNAQNSFRIPAKPEVNRTEPISYPVSWGNLKTTATATCPTSPVTLAGQDTLGNAVANGQTFACNNTPFYIYVPITSGNIASPCIETEYTPFHTSEGTHGTETFYEGGTNIGCIGPAGGGCQFPIGQGGANNTNWGLILSLLDGSQQHDFVFCRNGNITGAPTTTITLIDCWTGVQLPSVPASSIFNNTNPPNTATCFTMTLPANTDIGSAVYSISPTVTPGAFIDFHDGEAYVNSPMLNAGTYTVGYTFTPPASSGCGMVTGNFTFTITNQTPTVTVNSPFICSGGTDTLRANGATTYSWTPATGLSATTGSVVAVTPTASPTSYTVTGTNGACSSTATSTVTITSNPAITVSVTTGTICAGITDTLIANGANTYTWSPSTDLSSANGSTVTTTPSTTAVYTVTGSVGTCSATPATVTVTVNQLPVVTVNSASLCLADTATLTANGAATYSWSPSTGLSTTTNSVVAANPTVTTIYTVTGTTSGCSSSATSTVTVYSMPTFTVNKATICSGNSVSLIASDSTLSYTWTPATGLNTTSNDTVIATPSTTTVYTITGSNPACPSLTITDSVIVNLSPTITVLSPTVCSGTTATITAVGAATYTWSPLTSLTSTVTNDTVYISNPTTNLTYTAYGTDLNGCKDSAVSSILISNHLGIYSGTPIIRCFGTPFGLGAIGASTYTWTSNDPANLDFGGDTTWAVFSSVANVGTYTLAIYGESHSGAYCNGNDTVYVTINPTPTLTASGNASLAICAGDSTSLTVTSSGPAITSYNWSPATGLSITTQSTVMASPSVTTVYTATGTDALGCSSSTNFTVSVIPVPSFTVNSTAFCLGGSDSLKVAPTTTVSGAQIYSWTPATWLNTTTGATVAVTPTIQGTYTYMATGTNTISTSSVTCSSTASSTVVVNPLPTVTVAPTSSICIGSPASIIAGGNAVTYTWTSTSTTFTAVANALIDAPAVTTVYTVTGTGAVGGCMASATTTVTVNDVPTFTISNSNPMFCKGDSSVLTAVPTSTTVATYTWTASGFTTTTANSVTVAPTTTTIYTVNATANVGGCPAVAQTTTVTVNQLPTLTVTPTNTTVCAGNMAAIAASGANTYTWSSTSTTYTAATNALADAPSTTTIYSVTGQDAFGCYSNTVTATINVTSVPTASASANNPICKGQTINLSANTVSGTATYSWTASNGYTSNTQNPTIPNATATNSATYSLTVTDNGCTSTVSIVAVVVNNPATVSVTPSATICLGGTVSCTASGSLNYTWTPATGLSVSSGSTVVANPTSTTIYSVTGTDVNNCISTKTLTVTVNPVVADMGANPETGDAPLNVQFTNLSSNANSYVWNYGNGSTQTTTSLSDSTTQATYTNVGTYTVVLTANNITGCVDKDTLLIIVTEGYSIVIPNVFTPNGDALNEEFVVKGEGISNYNIEILDRWGLKMFSSSSINTSWDGKTVGGKEVPADTYFYIINATSSKTGNSQTYKGYLTLIR